MQSLLNPNTNLPISFLSIQSNPTPPHNRTSLPLQPTQIHHDSLQQPIRRNHNPHIPFALNSATLDPFEPDLQNPTISTSFRNPNISKPNQTVLDAQARVCTGPTQTKPLTEDQARKVLLTILKSVTGELKDEEVVSKSQLGAFFAGMTIRAKSFPEATQWSDGEKQAMNSLWHSLVQVLPPDVIFIADPDGLVMGEGYSNGLHYVGNEANEMRLVRSLREVLQGGHVRYEDVAGVLRNVLPLGEGYLGKASDSLVSAFLIGQRMNRETDAELQGYCLAFDDEFGPPPVADVKSLTHYGEPYDGNTRYFRSTLFVAAVRACYGESCLLHGVEWMPPKGGVTEEQMLKFMGANTHLSSLQAKKLLEDKDVGFAYLSQREACPSLAANLADCAVLKHTEAQPERLKGYVKDIHLS